MRTIKPVESKRKKHTITSCVLHKDSYFIGCVLRFALLQILAGKILDDRDIICILISQK